MFAHVSEYLSTVTTAGRWTLGGLAVVWTGAAGHLARQTLILVRIHPRTRALAARLAQAARPVVLDRPVTTAVEASGRRPVRRPAREAVRPPQAITAGRRRILGDWRDRTFGKDPVGADSWADGPKADPAWDGYRWQGPEDGIRRRVEPMAQAAEPITVRYLDRVAPIRHVATLAPSEAMARLDEIIAEAAAAIDALDARYEVAAAEFERRQLVTLVRAVEVVLVKRPLSARPARRRTAARLGAPRRLAAVAAA